MTPMNDPNAVKIIPLGGLGEIGLNCLALEYQGQLLLIDCGLMFPEDFMLGVDIVIPDFTFLEDRSDDIIGLILTHGHEDHIGAVSFLLREHNPLIVGSRMTLAFLGNQLGQLKKLNGDNELSIEVVEAGDVRGFGPFEVEFIQVSHSIIGGFALSIRTPQGVIVHSGDFKLDFTPFNGEMTDLTRFAELGKEGVLCFLSDSTNVEQDGYTVSERDIALELENIFHHCQGRILVTLFASNLQRIHQIFEIAERFQRKVVLNGRSIISSVRIARELGAFHVDESQLLDIGMLENAERDKVVILCTGSQGEPMSVLSRIADDNHKHISIYDGDTVILSSKIIPGNERAVTNIINELYRKGAEVIYETISNIHTSGHAHREELKVLLRLVRPEHFVPIHGEYRHLVQHAKLAESMGVSRENVHVLEDGKVLALADNKAWDYGLVPSGRIYVDGHGVGDVGNIVLTDRRILSEDGTITCALAHRDGVVVSGPYFKSKGLVYEPEYRDLWDEAKEVVLQTIREMKSENGFDEQAMRVEVVRVVRRLFSKRIGRRPIVIPVLMEV
ncbi:MAG: ribonuclease J [Candidatus Lernaella stagnicola]|nr:ribonuclease J [Candidatus Lernaella stagnicola]